MSTKLATSAGSRDNEILLITDFLTKNELEMIENMAEKKARFLTNTQEVFELLYSKFYLELMQEKVLEIKKKVSPC